MKNRNEVYLPKFETDFDEIFLYLQRKSPQSAIKFAENTNRALETIKQNPKLFTPENYLPTKHNLYRFALVMKSWKIIYKHTKTKLIFLGIIHTAQHPREIKNLRTRL